MDTFVDCVGVFSAGTIKAMNSVCCRKVVRLQVGLSMMKVFEAQ